MHIKNISEKEFLLFIKEVMDIEVDVTFETELNIFEYDSLAKVGLIVAIETYTVHKLDMNKFLLCNTFQDLIDLIKETERDN